MTFLSGTNTELLYVMPAAGSVYNNSSAQTIISGNTSTNPPYQMPSLYNLWGPSYAVARALRVVARGIFATTGTPTLKVVCGLNTTQGTASPAIVLAGTGAFTTASGVANGMWELEFGIDINSLGTGANSSLDAMGSFRLGVGNNAATTAATMYMVGSTAAITTVNPTTSYWLELAALWGTANASNTLTCFQFEVFGLN